MRQINYNVQTGETTFSELPDIETPVIEPVANLEDRVVALEGTTTEIVVALNDKGLIP